MVQHCLVMPPKIWLCNAYMQMQRYMCPNQLKCNDTCFPTNLESKDGPNCVMEDGSWTLVMGTLATLALYLHPLFACPSIGIMSWNSENGSMRQTCRHNVFSAAPKFVGAMQWSWTLGNGTLATISHPLFPVHYFE